MSEHNLLAPSDTANDQQSPNMAECYPMTGEVLEDGVFGDTNSWDMSSGHVEVDQTPLQLHIQKNKECK